MEREKLRPRPASAGVSRAFLIGPRSAASARVKIPPGGGDTLTIYCRRGAELSG